MTLHSSMAWICCRMGTAGCSSKGTTVKHIDIQIKEWEIVKHEENTLKGNDLYGLSTRNFLHWEERQLGAIDSEDKTKGNKLQHQQGNLDVI